MSWLRDDDDMLDHEKWRRAIRDGGDGVLLVWYRLRSWCARRLTDGVIPADMIAEVAELARSKSRMRALQALVDARLCARREDGALTIVDYLERNPSREQVLSARAASTDRKRKHRLKPPVPPVSQRGTPSLERPAATPHPIPSQPIPKLSNESEDTRAPDVPDVPGLEIVHPGPLPPSKRDRALDAEASALNATLPLMHRYPKDFEPTKANQAQGHFLGLTDEEIFARWDEDRFKYYPKPFDDPEAQFNRDLAFAKRDKETAHFKQFKTKSERDAFENPGRERRAT